jgi:hypothetical protein
MRALACSNFCAASGEDITHGFTGKSAKKRSSRKVELVIGDVRRSMTAPKTFSRGLSRLEGVSRAWQIALSLHWMVPCLGWWLMRGMGEEKALLRRLAVSIIRIMFFAGEGEVAGQRDGF